MITRGACYVVESRAVEQCVEPDERRGLGMGPLAG